MSPRAQRSTVERAGAHTPALDIGFVLAPNFTMLPFAAFIDAIRLAADEGDRSRQIACRWTVMGEGAQPITASCGVAITPWEPYRDPADFDYVVVVGGLLGKREGKGNSEHDRDAAKVTDYLRAAAASKCVLVGLGTGTFILARAGVMDGYRSCVSWYHLNDFRTEFPH